MLTELDSFSPQAVL